MLTRMWRIASACGMQVAEAHKARAALQEQLERDRREAETQQAQQQADIIRLEQVHACRRSSLPVVKTPTNLPCGVFKILPRASCTEAQRSMK
jgi:hypothetical protein